MLKTNSTEAILKFTKPFEGCSLINFDELPHCDNFKGMQDGLKGLITEDLFICRDMFTSGYEQKNTFNIIITTNNDAVSLTQTNNNRYVVMDIDESKIDDVEYFKKLKNAIRGKNVLEAFYNQMAKRYEKLDKNWIGNTAPQTQSKKLKIIEGLPTLYKYLKEKYILKNIDLNTRTDSFLVNYKVETKDKTSNQKLGRMLTELGIKPIKNSKNLGYNYKKTAKDLYDIFKSKNWIDECIDVINEDNNIEISEDEIKAEELHVDKTDKSVSIQIEDHVDLINGFEKQMNNLKEYLSDLKDDLHNQSVYVEELECKYYDQIDEIAELKSYIKKLEDTLVFGNEPKKPPKINYTTESVNSICNLFENF
eukprot:gene3282-6498_t